MSTRLPPEEKARKVSVSLYPSQLDAIAPRLATHHAGQLSAYLQHLIERDLDATPPDHHVSPDILERLAATFAGYLAPRLRVQLSAHSLDQPGTLHAVLAHLLETLEAATPSASRPTALHCAFTTLDLAYPETSPAALAAAEPAASLPVVDKVRRELERLPRSPAHAAHPRRKTPA